MSDTVRSIEIGLQLVRVYAFGVTCVGTVCETANVVRRQSFLFLNLVFFETSEQLLRFRVGREAVLRLLMVDEMRGDVKFLRVVHPILCSRCRAC